MFDPQKFEFICDRVSCGNTAKPVGNAPPQKWVRLSEDVVVKDKTVHRWWDLCPLCAQLLSVTTK